MDTFPGTKKGPLSRPWSVSGKCAYYIILPSKNAKYQRIYIFPSHFPFIAKIEILNQQQYPHHMPIIVLCFPLHSHRIFVHGSKMLKKIFSWNHGVFRKGHWSILINSISRGWTSINPSYFDVQKGWFPIKCGVLKLSKWGVPMFSHQKNV